jgi:hypothetical protein
VISLTASKNETSFAFDGLLKPLIFLTNWRDAARISSAVERAQVNALHLGVSCQPGARGCRCAPPLQALDEARDRTRPPKPSARNTSQSVMVRNSAWDRVQ